MTLGSLGYFGDDIGTFRERGDGQWRTDSAQKAEEEYHTSIKAAHARRTAFAQRIRDDPILTEMVEVASRAGFSWNEKYDFVELVEKLIRRTATPPQDEETI